MKKYLMIIKGAGPSGGSPEEMQHALQDYMNWAGGIGDQYVDGQRLEPTGVLVEDRDTVQTDGPFLEAKEIIAGYIIIVADSIEGAIEITKGCPLMDHCSIEVRPILEIPG